MPPRLARSIGRSIAQIPGGDSMFLRTPSKPPEWATEGRLLATVAHESLSAPRGRGEEGMEWVGGRGGRDVHILMLSAAAQPSSNQAASSPTSSSPSCAGFRPRRSWTSAQSVGGGTHAPRPCTS